VKLSQCIGKNKIYFNPPVNTIGGTPTLTTDLYLRSIPSTLSFAIKNITGLEKLVPYFPNEIFALEQFSKDVQWDYTYLPNLDIENGKITACQISTDTGTCRSCVPCNTTNVL
jgi:hypothetical protein